jgi:predicted peroxiredoxin
MADHEKLVFMVTHGPNEPELATIPFVMGVAALAADVEVVIGFQGDAVRLIHKGEAERIEAAGFPPMAKLLNDLRELGGTLLVCKPCLVSRNIDDPESLIDGAEVVAAARFVAEVTSSTQTLVY